MAAEADDPREGVLHPRFSEAVVGNESAAAKFRDARAHGRAHHAWLLAGPKGIGKATLAYTLAAELLSESAPPAKALIEARSHPDLFVLERRMGDGKAAKLKSEIAVDDARTFGSFFARTAAMAKWRVALVDTADDFNAASANALLKVLEEPPPNCFILLISNQPGTVLRTIRSRCARLDLEPLDDPQMEAVFAQKKFAHGSGLAAKVVALAGGSPGRALALMSSEAATAFGLVSRDGISRPEGRLAILNAFRARTLSTEDFELFTELLMSWLAAETSQHRRPQGLAEAYQLIDLSAKKTLAFNLDRKLAILDNLVVADDALKAA